MIGEIETNKSEATSGGFQLSLLSIGDDMKDLVERNQLGLPGRGRDSFWENREQERRLVNTLSRLLGNQGRVKENIEKDKVEDIPLVMVEE